MRDVITPITAQAGTGYAMQEGAGGIARGDHIYFGTKHGSYTWTDAYPYWRVLDATNTNAGASGMFLLSENLIGDNTGGTWVNVYFDNTLPYSNDWASSTAKSWCGTFLTNVFPKEQYAILATNKTDSVYKSTPSNYQYGICTLNGDKVFFLSAEEAESISYGFRDDSSRIAYYRSTNNAGYWWLRSPYTYFTDDHAGVVDLDGSVEYDGVAAFGGARPAFNLNLSSVLFTSDAVGGKSSGGAAANALTAVSASANPTEWKLTLLDDGTIPNLNGHAAFTVDANAVTYNADTGILTVPYTGATTGTNEYVSAIIKDTSRNIKYYGRIKELQDTGDANGTADVLLTGKYDKAAGDTLLVFNEQFNDDRATDYASKLTTVPVPDVSVNPTTIDFGSKPEGYGTIGAQNITVSNTESGTVSIKDVAVSGAAAYEFTCIKGGNIVPLPVSLVNSSDDLAIGVNPRDGLAPGSYDATMTIAYNDGTDKTARVTLRFTVTGIPATAPTITTTAATLPSGRAGDVYSTTLSANGTAPITWSATGLPAGLSINSTTGEISGTPTEIGTFNVSVTATNSAGNDTKTLTLNIVPASVPVPTPTPTPVPTPTPTPAPTPVPHSHQYEWVTLREADEHNDGEMVYRCRDCGDVLYSVPMTAYYVFNRNTAEKIRKAEQGATLLIETRRWISFHKMVMQALADRPDVTLQVRFLDGEYRGNLMSFTIPAGTDTLSLTNEEGYCGFLYLGSIFGLHPAEGN